MGILFDHIRRAIVEDRLGVTNHADDRLRERGVLLWQLIADVDSARLISERPGDLPNPSVELEQLLPDGTPVKVVWAWIATYGLALLVTVHFLDSP